MSTFSEANPNPDLMDLQQRLTEQALNGVRSILKMRERAAFSLMPEEIRCLDLSIPENAAIAQAWVHEHGLYVEIHPDGTERLVYPSYLENDANA